MEKQLLSEIKTKIDRLFAISKFPISLVSSDEGSIYCRPMEDSYFLSSNLIRYFLETENVMNKGMFPYMHITDDEIMFGIIPLENNLFIFVGPVSSFTLSIASVAYKYEKYFEPSEFSRISSVYFYTTKTDALSFANFLAEIYDLFNHKSFDANNILIQNSIVNYSLPPVDTNASYESNDNIIEINEFVKFENSIFSAISVGNQSSVDIIWQNIKSILVPDMNINIDGVHYMALSLLTVFRRASLKGGADNGEAFDLYDKSLKKVLNCKTSTEYYSTIVQASYLFCKTVASKKIYGPYTSHAKKCEKYIQTNIGQKITIHTLALLCGLSDRQICRIFSECFNSGVTEYIQNEKIRQAKIMLSSGDNKIIDISNQLGYSSQSHFSKMFLRMTGYTPNEFRNIKR